MIQRRRSLLLGLTGVLVGLGLTAAPPGVGRPAPAERSQRAVVSLADGARDDVLEVPGVVVVSRQQHLGTAVVQVRSGTALRRLVRRPGVRGVYGDSVLAPTAKDDNAADGRSDKADKDESSDNAIGSSRRDVEGVFAWQGLGPEAGKPGAGRGVTVALIDTGVADTAALSRTSGRLVDGVDTSGEGRLADGYGHGTFMAGLIAGGAVPGTGERTLGIAAGATVLNVKVAGRTGETSLSKVLAGFDWLLGSMQKGRRIDVLSFSFSRTRPGPGYGPDPLTDAVEKVRDAGVTVVASAGNVPGEVGDPGFHPRVLSVGAADLTGKRPRVADFSGGATVAGVVRPDLVASGVHVLGLLPPESVIAQQNPQSLHGRLWRGSGTSQATATTAGVAALFRARFPTASPTEVKASLRAAARKVAGRHGGAGLVSVATSLRDGTDGPSGADGGGDGEGGFDAGSWSAGSWSAGSWSAGSWSAGSWSAGSWSSFWGTDG